MAPPRAAARAAACRCSRAARKARRASSNALGARPVDSGRAQSHTEKPMLRLPRFLAFAALASSGAALGAPQAQSALECGIAADMAVVAHLLAKEQIQRNKADGHMARICGGAQFSRGRARSKENLDASLNA